MALVMGEFPDYRSSSAFPSSRYLLSAPTIRVFSLNDRVPISTSFKPTIGAPSRPLGTLITFPKGLFPTEIQARSLNSGETKYAIESWDLIA